MRAALHSRLRRRRVARAGGGDCTRTARRRRPTGDRGHGLPARRLRSHAASGQQQQQRVGYVGGPANGDVVGVDWG